MSEYERIVAAYDKDLNRHNYDFSVARARIAELETELQHQVERREEEKLRAVEAEARCKELAEEAADRIGALLKAEAALAERDRMLAREYESSTPRMAGYMRWYEDLRARAEEGSRDE